ncbi:MAG: hypothetical protein U0U66_05000 [Cytophagaceae bacterium]
MGLFYFLFCWYFEYSDTSKAWFIFWMLFLPGVTFPLTTSYYKNGSSYYSLRKKLSHLIVSVVIYHVSSWLFYGESYIRFSSLFAGFIGSFLYLLSIRYMLKKDLSLPIILLVSILSGLAFLPYQMIERYRMFLGLAIFIWTFVNGFVLNREYKKSL